MRKVALIGSFIFIVILCYAQRDSWKNAEKYFSTYQYASAARAYEQILSADTGNKAVIEKLVACYEKLNDPTKAEPLLKTLCSDEQVDPKYIKKYAKTLAENANYNEAVEWYKKYIERSPDEQAQKVLEGYRKFASYYRDSSFYRIDKVGFNSPQSDFSPIFFKGSLVFCSARSGKKKSNYAWSNTPFIDLYWAKDLSSTPDPLGPPVNSDFHEGPAAFTLKYDTIFFTRNNYVNNKKGKSRDGVMKLKVFYSVMTDGIWGKVQGVPFNSDEYSVGHPAISLDHKLYFVSDMPGGMGGRDIYYVTLENGEWSKPVNIGAPVNTPGDEMFPYIDEKSDLYFASNGHPGMGGLDIFHAPSKDGGFGEPENMGYPVNSSRDDFGLISYDGKGYFTSNRGNDPMDDNIYAFSMLRSLPLTIMAVDSDGKPLENYTLVIQGNSTPVQVEKSYISKFNIGSSYSITCSKEGYLTNEKILDKDIFSKIGDDKVVKIVMKESEKTVNVKLSSEDGQPLKAGTVELRNLTTNEIKTYAVNADGTVSLPLDRNINYEITGKHTGYKSKTQSLSTATMEMLGNLPEVSIELAPNPELFETNEIGQIIELDIKYDLGKYNIRADAAKELDKLVDFLNKNPTLKVELGSHTDSRGGDEQNLKLSQRRAESCVRYVVAKGIDSKRLVPIGYGEGDLKVKEATTEEEHQQNRRTTVKIVGK